MRIQHFLPLPILLMSLSAFAEPSVNSASISCNWGLLTMEAIGSGFDQGEHSSDPGGDGQGPGTGDEPRAGLANVVEPGNLQATCELIAGLFVADVESAGPTVNSATVDCNWGRLTMEAIGDGFDQGEHSSDPSGDGWGPGTVDEPRAGLANVLEQGNLQATCDFISSL